MTPIEMILGKLHGVQSHGSYYTALCPGHDDNRQSLSVSEGDDGRALLKCHAGCEPSNIVAALGLKMSDLFPKGDGRGEIEATYDYHDASGTLAYQVVRFKPKNFVCRRPGGAGGWHWNLNGTERVLYHLPDLLAEPGRVVFIAEGEKSVDAVRGLGLLATTNPHGAGKWGNASSEPLRGRPVVILPDNDGAGLDHAVDVARDLLTKAASVRVLELPGLADKGDVVDWIGRGGDRDTLTQLANGAPLAAMWLEARAAAMPNKATQAAADEDIHLTDMGNAARLAGLHGDDLRYIHPWHKWLTWDGQRWALDNTAYVTMLGKDTVREMYLEASQIHDDKERERLARHALRSEGKERIKAMIELTASEPGIPLLPEDLDCNPWLLNVQNGTVDLRTGELLEHDKDKLVTKLAPIRYDPDAACPLWLKFLSEIMPDEATVTFLQRAIGYSLTGDVSERCLFILHGCGANGKTVFLETIHGLLGDYAQRTPTETIMLKRMGGIPNDVARLRGARFVNANESEEGRRLAESFVKDLTGGDTISARFLHGEFFDFKPECKIWLRTNHKPEIRGTDKAIWDRIRLIPFGVRIPESKQDKRLASKLRAELSGILAWAVRGCLDWQANGLGTTDKVKTATAAYQVEMDILGQWLADCCIEGPDKEALAGDLYTSFKDWGGELGQHRFGRALRERGFDKSMKTAEPNKGRILWRGLGLVDHLAKVDHSRPLVNIPEPGTDSMQDNGKGLLQWSTGQNGLPDPVLEAAQAMGGEVISVVTANGVVEMPF